MDLLNKELIESLETACADCTRAIINSGIKEIWCIAIVDDKLMNQPR